MIISNPLILFSVASFGMYFEFTYLPEILHTCSNCFYSFHGIKYSCKVLSKMTRRIPSNQSDPGRSSYMLLLLEAIQPYN